MSQETETRREIANRLEAVVRVLNAKIGKYGSATHHLSNITGAMSSAFLGSISHWPDVAQSAGRLSAALREEGLNEWRSIHHSSAMAECNGNSSRRILES